MGNFEEIVRTDQLYNDDCVLVSEGEAPDGFEEGAVPSEDDGGCSKSSAGAAVHQNSATAGSRVERLRKSYRKTFNPKTFNPTDLSGS